MSRYLYLCSISFSCFLACNGGDKVWKEIKEEASELKEASEYSGKVSESDYRNGCKQIENKIKTIVGSTKKSERSNTLENYFLTLKGSTFSDSIEHIQKLFKDSLNLFCDAASIRAKYGPYNINVFLENSRNMDGYIDRGTNFKKDVSELLYEIASINEGAKQTLYHINNKVNEKYSDGKIDEIINNLDYWSFKERGGDTANRKFVVFKNMINTAIFYANDSSMSIIISNFSIPEDTARTRSRHPDAYINFVKGESRNIGNSLGKKGSSLLVLRLESDFRDCYYDINGKCYIASSSNEAYIRECILREQNYRYAIAMQKMCEEQGEERNCYKKEPKKTEVWNTSGKEAVKICANSKSRIKIDTPFLRPYFVWILGTNQQIEQVLKASFFTKRNNGDSLWLAKYIRSHSELRSKEFEIIPDKKNESVNKPEFVYYRIYGDSINVIRAKNNSKLEIPIRLNLGKITEILPEIYKDSANYKLNESKHFEIKDIKELSKNSNKWTHSLMIKNKDIASEENITIASLMSDTPFLLATINVERETWAKNHPWIEKYSCETDTLFAGVAKTSGNYNAKQTRGLKILLENVYNAFYEQPLDSFKIKIGVKK